MSTLAEPKFEFDPFSADVMSRPEAYFRKLRDDHPVYYSDKYDTFFFSRFEDVWNVLRIGNNTFVATESNLPTPEYLRTTRNIEAPPFASTNPMSPGNKLPSPYYEEMRQAHIAPLRPVAVRKMEDFIRTLARSHLDELLPRGRFDLTGDYAVSVTARTICHLFGLPMAAADDVLDKIDAVGRYDPDSDGVDISAFWTTLQPSMLPLIEARRAAGADGGHALIDGLINYRSNPEGRALSDAEISDQLVCAMVGGMEAVPKVTGQGIMELWKRPDQLAAIRADMTTNLPIAVQEMVRYCAPAQYTFRTAHRDVTVAGHDIRAGQRVACLLKSASRDSREFDDPDDFIWNRPIPRVVSFGLGQHHCIGKHLALLEVRIFVEEFLSRVRAFEVIIDEAGLNPGYFQKGWIKMPVEIYEYA
jgi:cytochrome P450